MEAGQWTQSLNRSFLECWSPNFDEIKSRSDYTEGNVRKTVCAYLLETHSLPQ